MNDLCYEWPQDDVSLNSFDCVFVHKEVRCANKTEIIDGLQYANKKPSLPGDMIIYTPEDLVMNYKRSTFSFYSWPFLYEVARTTVIIPWKKKRFWILKI